MEKVGRLFETVHNSKCKRPLQMGLRSVARLESSPDEDGQVPCRQPCPCKVSSVMLFRFLELWFLACVWQVQSSGFPLPQWGDKNQTYKLKGTFIIFS